MSADPLRDDSGMALILVLTATIGLASIGLALLLMTDVEVTAAGNQRDAAEVFHAADGALDYVIQEMALVPDWDDVLSGTVRSRAKGTLVLPVQAGGSAVDAVRLTQEVQQSSYGGSPWGTNTPRWTLFAHGSMARDLGVTGLPDRVYVLVWVSDDIAEADDDPARDSNGIVVVRVRALGVRGSRCDVQAVIARTSTAGVVRKVSWRTGG